MRKLGVCSVAVTLGLGIAACSGNDASAPEATGDVKLTLHGDGRGVTLESAPANAGYKPSYPVEHVRQMVVTLKASGVIEATCTGDKGEAKCDDTPFFSRITMVDFKNRLQVFDLYGQMVVDVEGPPVGPVHVASASAAAVDGGSENQSACETDAGPACDVGAAKAHFCAAIDKWLADHHINDTVDCTKLDDKYDYAHAKAVQHHENIPCLEIITSGWEEAKAELKGCGANADNTVMNWKSSSRFELLQSGACRGSPLVLDLDGDGIQLSSLERGTSFDLLGTGPVQSAWPSGGDAFLALDWNKNGAIDGAAELFGNVTHGSSFEDGFSALSELDANGDGRIDARDPAFAELLVWKDQNRDGKSTGSELVPLRDAGVRALELHATRDDGPSSWDSHGNSTPLVSRFVRDDGQRGMLVDAYLRFQPRR